MLPLHQRLVFWCIPKDSNLRRPRLQRGALPTELGMRVYWWSGDDLNVRPSRGATGLQPGALPLCHRSVMESVNSD